jgi:hypothetical protein
MLNGYARPLLLATGETTAAIANVHVVNSAPAQAESEVTHVQLHFSLASDPSVAAQAMQSLNAKLSEEGSTLGAIAGNAVSDGPCTACGAHPGQMAAMEFVCPGNMVRLDGQNTCRHCLLDERPNANDNACEKCPLGEENPKRQRTCQCKVSAILGHICRQGIHTCVIHCADNNNTDEIAQCVGRAVRLHTGPYILLRWWLL